MINVTFVYQQKDTEHLIKLRHLGQLFGFWILLTLFSCGDNKRTISLQPVKESLYLNHHDSVKYIGMDQCKMCHSEKHKTFIHTGMGSSFDLATPHKSSAVFREHSTLFDSTLNVYYKPFWKDSVMVLKEFRLGNTNKDTLFSRIQPINYVIGSGQHTNSHLVNSNGYVTQAPFTYYTQDGHLDFPPGFDNGKNTRFSRQIGLECMSCHNGMSDFVLGSENKFTKVARGIDCERCHGPGELHVQQFRNGERTDTSKFIDYTIVNPKDLSPKLQFDLCSRCHLQGNMVLKEGKHFYDFKPGMELTEVLDVFLPKYTDSDDKFIMASHVDRLKMSNCFTASEDLTCLTCHNPHVSVKKTSQDVFNSACLSCHQSHNSKMCSSPDGQKEGSSCISCHMPKSGSSDIPHVRITDHKIGIRNKTKTNSDVEGEFLELYCVNNEHPDTLTLIKGYLQQYERFTALDELLNKADGLIRSQPFSMQMFKQKVHLNFLRNQGGKSLAWLPKLQKNWMTTLVQSYDNSDAWMLYRLANASMKKGDVKNAFIFYEKCIDLAPFKLNFKLVYGKDLMKSNQISKAQKLFLEIVKENPKYEKVYTPLAYSFAAQQDFDKADFYYQKAIELDPNDFHAKSNRAGLKVMQGKREEAKKLLKEVLKEQPHFNLAKQMLQQLN